MTSEEIRNEADDIVWFHTMELAPGVVTKGYDDTPWRLRRIAFPRSLAGKTVLDIGTWDGFFAFEAERRGAADVVAIDSFAWNAPGWSGRRGFDLAHRALGSRVRSIELDVMDISEKTLGQTFDVVLLLGVLYHLKHPLLALERISSITRELIIVETEADNLFLPWPTLAFYPERQLNDDPTNWFAPNLSAAAGLLRAAGFAHASVAARASLARRLVRALKLRLKGQSFVRTLGRDRITVVAHKGRPPQS